MAGAWDLVARIQSDRGEGDLAFDAWTTVLRLAPDHVGACKGLAFLCYRAGDHPRSLRYMQRAAELAPGDAAVTAALARVREAAGAKPIPGYAEPAPDPLAWLDAEPGLAVLVDRQGRILAGAIRTDDGRDAGEAVAAALGRITREAERAAKLLGLGTWRRLALEGGPAHFEIRTPTVDSVLLVTRPRVIPAGRLGLLADRAATAARRWLEELR
jgi:predicted regulator of Ras-like GTPase activity (Roadblock/LC7/MglB family)